MNLIPRKPFREIEEFFNDDDWFLPVFSRKEASPEMDIYETDDSVVAEISAPGMKAEDLSVTVENGILEVKGKSEHKEEKKEKGYYRKEIRKGSFERAVRLPSNVNESKVEASYEDGILKLRAPKIEGSKGREIEIKSK